MHHQTSNALGTPRTMLAALALSLGAVACGQGVDSTSPLTPSSVISSDRREMTPPAEYALWWKMTEACSGVSANMSDVHFYVGASTSLGMDRSSGDSLVGQWVAASNSIVLAQSEISNPAVVRHEMLHALTRSVTHTRSAFRVNCGGYVNCEASCIREAGSDPYIATSAPWISRNDLVVSQVLYRATATGWTALAVEVENPTASAVWVRLSPFPGRSDMAATFGYASGSGSHQSMIAGDSVAFAPHEVKRAVFDLTASELDPVNGAAALRGFFNAVTSPGQYVSVGP